ncbi:MAG: metallophosphoesterase [Candidatus Absconditabacteria bacterium]|nr:metallophosphoesterase [Candidatus Absconditabacteria bacterium]
MKLSIMNILIGVISFTLVTALIFYACLRRSKIFGRSGSYKQAGICTLIIFCIIIISLLTEEIKRANVDIISSVGIWIVSFIVFSTPFLALHHLISKRVTLPSRSIILVMVIIFAIGAIQTLNTKLTNITISSPKITQPLKIFFVTDIHVDSAFHTIHLETLKKEIKNQNPDLVLIGGDMLDNVKEKYVLAYEVLNDIGVPIYATLGNHDTMGEVSISEKIQDISEIVLLRNESINSNGIQIVGIDDKSIWGEQTLEEILSASDIQNDGEFTILITHQPISLSKLVDYPIDLELAGHTHRGQNLFIMPIAKLVNEYFYGRYDEEGKTAIVSQGIGTRGLPFRLGSQSEIMVLNLVKK